MKMISIGVGLFPANTLCINNQSPITKLQLITNTQYTITKQRLAGIVSRLGIRSLVIGYYLVIDVWLLVIMCSLYGIRKGFNNYIGKVI